MSNWFKRDSSATDDSGRDMLLAEALKVFDPMHGDPNYWFRFREWVMTGAARELARRRFIADLTVGDVLTSWARAVIPTAAIAAALAGIMLMRSAEGVQEDPIGVEELLASDIPLETLPLLLSPDDAVGIVAFASEIF